jgi:hypothetical protein
MSDNFTLIPFDLPGKIYRSTRPFSDFDPFGELIPTYRASGVEIIVVLTENTRAGGGDLLDLYRNYGFQVIHAPVPDFGIPETGAYASALGRVIAELKRGRTVVVHCYAGLGRTGTFLAIIARKLMNLDGPAAVKWLRGHVPGSVETDLQEAFVAEFDLEKIQG